MGHRGKKSKRGIKGGNIIQKGIRGLAPCPPAPLRVNSVSSVNTVIGVDPGIIGAIVALGSDGNFRFWEMPVIKDGKIVNVDFFGLRNILDGVEARGPSRLSLHVFLERAMPFLMPTRSAFNYGRGFAAIEIALQDLDIPFTLVEPGKWTKAMHAGIKGDLKPKAKSVIAARRLYPKLFRQIPVSPKSKQPHMGVVDALLIAGFGSRNVPPDGEVKAKRVIEDDVGDFF